jgi:hypothetical protein
VVVMAVTGLATCTLKMRLCSHTNAEQPRRAEILLACREISLESIYALRVEETQ